MSPEEQAKSLAEWLERHPGTDPPSDLDPEVVEAVYALRPDLAPAPRVSAEDILAALTAGPLADKPVPVAIPEVAAAEDPVQSAPVVSLDAARRRRRLIAWTGGATAGVLAMAAAAALFVGVTLTATAPDTVALNREAPPAVDAPIVRTGAEREEAYDAVASLDEEELTRGYGDLAADAYDEAPEPEPEPLVAVSRPRPSPRAVDVQPPPRPSPSPAPVVATRPPPLPAKDLEYDAVADVDGDAEDAELRPSGRAAAVRAPDEASGGTGATAGDSWGPGQVGGLAEQPEAAKPSVDDETRSEALAGARVADTAADGSDDRSARARQAQSTEDVSETVSLERGKPFQIRLGRKDSGTRASEVIVPESGAAAAEDPAPTPAPPLDALRAAAIPPELPEAELMNRNAVPEPAWQSIVTDRNQGRYDNAAETLRQHVAPPVDQGQTNAAQAAHYYRQAGDDTSALATAQEGLSLSMNTPEAAWLLVYTGDALREQGDLHGAEVAYREAIRMNDARNAPVRLREMQLDAAESQPTGTQMEPASEPE